MNAEIHHIRRPYPRTGGTSFRKSTVTFDEGKWLNWTVCGAEVTGSDVAWKSRATKWTKANACEACLAQVEEVAVR